MIVVKIITLILFFTFLYTLMLLAIFSCQLVLKKVMAQLKFMKEKKENEKKEKVRN